MSIWAQMPNLDVYLQKQVFDLSSYAMLPYLLDKEEIRRVVIAAQLRGTKKAYQALLRQLDCYIYDMSACYAVAKIVARTDAIGRQRRKGCSGH